MFEIKNKDIYANLNEGEEIVYIAQKDKNNFFLSLLSNTIYLVLALCALAVLIIFFSDKMGAAVISLIIGFILIFLMFCFVVYMRISDYFRTEVVFTNQRLIISRLDKLEFINNDEIESMYWYWCRGIDLTLKITIKEKNPYLLSFIKKPDLRNKFKEMYPGYDDSKEIAKEKRDAIFVKFIVPLLVLLYILFKYLSTK